MNKNLTQPHEFINQTEQRVRDEVKELIKERIAFHGLDNDTLGMEALEELLTKLK